MNSESIKILVADDHKLFRRGIIKMLSEYPEISIIGEAENGEELIMKYFQLNPDISLVDISMPVLSGIEAAKKILDTDESAKILFLSMYDNEEFVYSCLVTGGYGLVNKNIMEDELISAIKKIHTGQRYFGKEFNYEKLNFLINKLESVHKKETTEKKSILSRRELEILQYISEGFTSQEIADKLDIGLRTVDTHRTHLIQKLHLNSLSDLIRYAIEYNYKKEG